MKKVTFLILFVLILVVGLIGGYSQKDESLEVLNKYYNNIKSNNLDMNYDYLSNTSRNIWKKENYIEWESISLQVLSFKEVKIKKTNEYKDKELDGIKYKNVVEYNITEFNHDNYNDKEINSNYGRYVVNENGKWKIYRGKEDPKNMISEVKSALAYMYFTGKGKNKDLNQAENILKKSIEENANYSVSYYFLGFVYDELQRYDDAIYCEQQYIDKVKSTQEKSKGYFDLGIIYEDKKDYSSAKEYYKKAIEGDPSNKEAKEWLDKLNSK